MTYPKVRTQNKLVIFSGGQTGVDRAALDAAQKYNYQCAGWCPKGRLAEDGIIDQSYPLHEVQGGYAERTKLNVLHSDASLIIYFSRPYGGTQLALSYCDCYAKPYLLIDALKSNSTLAANKLHNFISEHKLVRLNVAGPRQSENNESYSFTFNLFKKFFNLHPATQSFKIKQIIQAIDFVAPQSLRFI